MATRTVSLVTSPRAIAAATAAHDPVPQASVSPTPRSCTRSDSAPGPRGAHASTFAGPIASADAVRADAGPPVAETAGIAGIERGAAVGLVDDDEVIPAAVHLRESHAATPPSGGTSSSASVVVGSTHRMRGSRRNQVIWRREYART